jgi:hypothetical protein
MDRKMLVGLIMEGKVSEEVLHSMDTDHVIAPPWHENSPREML